MAIKTPSEPSSEETRIAARCAEMIAQIETEARSTADYTGRSRFDSRVLAAIKRVPRHEFVPASEKDMAYLNIALPIGHGQTISQPYIVALMTDLLALEPDAVVLEIGTGSGYQAAVLAQMVRQVYSVETIPAIAAKAKARFTRLGFTNIEVRVGDGYYGWPEHAPFDGIVVTAAAPQIPPLLVEQLKPGGRLVIPLGRPLDRQDLTLAEKSEDNQLSLRSVLPVAFVPFQQGRSIEPVEQEGENSW
ncbi:MAG TPA: protein-L-isoaspartate(D-aspartate) O-methyltransferase [Gammaproteobacteria bacterium]|nr:protein-L-isoaspartate(D-aspartate) O-methyltransferase [Gammaproteobacteria bacterium]